MTLKTRLFGKRIEEEEVLRNLIIAMGRNSQEWLLDTRLGNSFTRSLTGRVSLTPDEKGIGVDLYIIRRYTSPSSPNVTSDDFLFLNPPDLTKDKRVYHLTGRISYNQGDGD